MLATCETCSLWIHSKCSPSDLMISFHLQTLTFIVLHVLSDAFVAHESCFFLQCLSPIAVSKIM